MLKILITIVALFLVGCTSNKPNIKHFSNTEFGGVPDVASFEKEINKRIKSRLKDPYSAKIGRCISTPIKASYVNAIPGWATVCPVNAKNSYGAYVGEKGYTAFIAYSKIKHMHFLMKVEPTQELLKDGLIIFGVND